MTAGASRLSPIRTKIFLLLAGPLLVAMGIGLGGFSPGAGGPDQQILDARATSVRETFLEILGQATEVARIALEQTPEAAWAAAHTLPGQFGSRIEGVGVLGPDLRYLAWEGSPAEPPASSSSADGYDWEIRVEGVRTRLVARVGPDDEQRVGLASFVVDSTLGDSTFARLFPTGLEAGVQIDFVLFDTESLPDARPLDPRRLSGGQVARTLESPGGDVLGVAYLIRLPAERRTERLHDLGRAWAVLIFLILLGVLFNWKTICSRSWGLPGVLAVLLLSRFSLVWEEIPTRLLPRSLGGPSLFGSSGLWDLLASPADLFLTAGTVFLICVACRTSWGSRARTHPRAVDLLATIAAVSATVLVLALTVTLARDSRIPLLERPGPFQWDGRMLLWAGLFLTLLGAAELWAVLWSLRTGRRDAGSARPVPIAVALTLLAVGSSAVLQQQSVRLAVEQLGSDFAPEVLEQGSRRRITLMAALGAIRDQAVEFDLAGDRETEFLAYRHWVDGDLFRSRYKSSLEFYSPTGELLSHFAFGLPPLLEHIKPFDPRQDAISIKEEWIESIGAQPRLLHAELPLFRDGELVAIVVGHVLDDPDNLPFLPWSQTYLAAMGPGTKRLTAETFGGGLHYVLYDAYGAVRITTLLQPPAETDLLRQSAAQGNTVQIKTGSEPYVALALEEEEEGRMHLLLLPALRVTERLGATVRMVLFGLLVLAGLTLVRRAFRPGTIRNLLPALMGSFYRKLMAAVLLASVLPLVGLALFLRGHIERRSDAQLIASATQFVRTAQRVVEDYSAGDPGQDQAQLNDAILHWLRGVVGQEIHVYRDGLLLASSTRELFSSGLLPLRLDGQVQRRLIREGLPYLVASQSVGSGTIPVAYAPVRQSGDGSGGLVVAVPLVMEQREIERSVSRIGELLLLATVTLVGLLAAAAALLARTVARPVGELVDATRRIADGDYGTRLKPRTSDEVADLVRGFNTMASALARQRSDLERRRDYTETLLRQVTTGVISLDPDGLIVTFNPAARDLLEPCSDDLVAGSRLRAVLLESGTFEPLARALQSMPSGEPVDVDLVRDEEQRRYRVVKLVLSKADGEGFGTMILLYDVTDLMRSNQLAAWAEMARAIAHEIKNPLTPIQLSTEHLQRLMRDRGYEPSDEEQACLDTIIKQVRALYDIAAEFAAYSKLPALALEPTDAATFMRTVVEPYRASSPPGVTIEEHYDPAPRISIDHRVLSRAVINLLENALQAMPGGGVLTASVALVANNGMVELAVADTGTGLEPGVRSRLFEPYFSTKTTGTGLGLAIARRAVEAHGGTIEVSSETDRGTVFRIRIPVHGYTLDDG